VTIDLSDGSLTAASVIRALGLLPHPEGGHYRETWRDPDPPGGRGAGTAILFLLAAGEASHWHRVDAAELWLWHAGAPLALRIAADGSPPAKSRLGPDLAGGAALQAVVPKDAWQAAASEGAWTLCSCVVTPAFRFAGFTLAPPDWEPAPSS
jgi:predicted cupin superfamily sugar epimerase